MRDRRPRHGASAGGAGNDALIAGAPTIITPEDCDVLTIEAASRRFFTEPALGGLAKGQKLVDPVTMFGSGHDEAALCRRLGISANLVHDSDVARWWNRDAPMAVEDVALTAAISRLVLWAHGASFLRGLPDAFFETLLPLRLRLLDMEAAPYDLSASGVVPVAIETPDGKAEYVRRQRVFAERGASLRARLLDSWLGVEAAVV